MSPRHKGSPQSSTATKWLIALLVVGLPLLLAALWFSSGGRNAVGGPEVNLASVESRSAFGRSRSIPKSFDSPTSSVSDLDSGQAAPKFDLVERVEPDANEAVKRVYSALEAKQNPELTGPMLSPPEFDRQSYQADPEAFLSITVPGRVWQSAQPGPDVPLIEQLSKSRHVVRKGEAIRLEVKTLPAMPVSFLATDLGTFENGLSSISVAAGDDGVAEAVFTASSGSDQSTEVLASSPVTSGRVSFSVRILP